MSEQALTRAASATLRAGMSGVLARPVAAVALVVGPLVMAVSNAAYALARRDGGNDLVGASALALPAKEPTPYQLSAVAGDRQG